MSANVRGIVAVSDRIETAGAITWWKLTGELNLDAVGTAWEAAGLPKAWLLGGPTPETAARRAANEHRGPRTLVRRVERRHWTVIRERVVEEAAIGEDGAETRKTLEHEATHHVRFVDGQGLVVESDDPKFVEDTRAHFNKAIAVANAEDVSDWLCRLVQKVNAVGLRDGGWRTICAVLKSASSMHTVYEVPAMKSSEAVRAITDAVTREAERWIEETEQVIAEGLGARGLKTRASAVQSLRGKVTAYEELLGQKLDALRDSLQQIDAQIATAILMSDQQKTEAA